MAYPKHIYTVDWQKLIAWLTPYQLRKVTHLLWLNALLSPIGTLHNKFLKFRKFINYQLQITSQVFSLEKTLNDRYDSAERRIVIEDGIERDPLPFFLKAENKPVVLHKKTEAQHKVLWTKAETAQFTVDFIIKIPSDVIFNETELRAFMRNYIVAKTFQIVIV